jgi:hypothetical protein
MTEKYVYQYINGETRAVHRVVMEEHLGRRLGPLEDVHHINGDAKDNRLENLAVLTRSEHRRLHMLTCPREDHARLAASRIGGKRSAETRAKMAEARRRWWATKTPEEAANHAALMTAARMSRVRGGVDGYR